MFSHIQRHELLGQKNEFPSTISVAGYMWWKASFKSFSFISKTHFISSGTSHLVVFIIEQIKPLQMLFRKRRESVRVANKSLTQTKTCKKVSDIWLAFSSLSTKQPNWINTFCTPYFLFNFPDMVNFNGSRESLIEVNLGHT